MPRPSFSNIQQAFHDRNIIARISRLLVCTNPYIDEQSKIELFEFANGALARPSGRALNLAVRDFDDNEFPQAYLITFRCYGTWSHGDERGSMRRKHHLSGTEYILPRPGLKR